MSEPLIYVERGELPAFDGECLVRIRCSMGDEDQGRSVLCGDESDFHFVFGSAAIEKCVEATVFETERVTIAGQACELCFYAKPWWREFSLPDNMSFSVPIIFVPAFGLSRSRWLDGPIVGILDGEVFAGVPLGSLTRLRFPIEVLSGVASGENANWNDGRGEGLLASMQSFIGQTIAVSGDLPIRAAIRDFSLPTMIAVILLKKYLGPRPMSLSHELDFKKWPASMKRVCQNIGLNLYERVESQETNEVGLDDLISQVGHNPVELGQCLNRYSAVLPKTLLD